MAFFPAHQIQALASTSWKRKLENDQKYLEDAVPGCLKVILEGLNRDAISKNLQSKCSSFEKLSDLSVTLNEYYDEGPLRNIDISIDLLMKMAKKTDLLPRLANMLSPGHFRCSMREYYDVHENCLYVRLNAHFYPVKRDELMYKGICKGDCPLHEKDFCAICGSFNQLSANPMCPCGRERNSANRCKPCWQATSIADRFILLEKEYAQKKSDEARHAADDELVARCIALGRLPSSL